MKNKAISKYFTRVSLFTFVFAVVIVLFVLLFFKVGYEIAIHSLSGSVRKIAGWIYNVMDDWFILIAIVLYVIGIIGVTFYTLNQFGNMIITAEKALSDDNSIIFSEDCPDELKGFADRLLKRRECDEENVRARTLAEQQKNDLIVYLAHDLKTPLTSVIGYLSLLEEAPDIPTEQRVKYTSIALDKAYRLEQLIGEFFDITRFNLQNISAQKTTVDLSVMLMQISEEFYPMLTEKGMTLEQKITPEIKLRADSDKLARAIDNLFKNAVNYGWENSEIVLSASVNDEKAVITLKNKGDEISPEKLSHIFDKFCRLDNARQSKTGGAGLGLAITKQIVELHGGSVYASCIGNDICFTVTLPILQNQDRLKSSLSE